MAAPRVFADWTEFEKEVGTTLGHSEWLEITQERIDAFADATDDHQWIHTDPERAAGGPFGGTIAHGYLTLALLPRFMFDVFTIERLSMAVNYGLDRVRFPAPVPVGSRIRGSIDFVEYREAKMGNLVTLRFTVEIEGTDRAACIADSLGLMVP
jgi:acyl dehydratase